MYDNSKFKSTRNFSRKNEKYQVFCLEIYEMFIFVSGIGSKCENSTKTEERMPVFAVQKIL